MGSLEEGTISLLLIQGLGMRSLNNLLNFILVYLSLSIYLPIINHLKTLVEGFEVLQHEYKAHIIFKQKEVKQVVNYFFLSTV